MQIILKSIANILTNKPFNDKELFNIVDDKGKLISDIPTLVIGWEFTKSLYPEADILDWEIRPGLYWTFGKREKRNRYEEDIKVFKTQSLKSFLKSVNYHFINVLTAEKEEKNSFFKDIENPKGAYFYIYNNMLYMYKGEGSDIYGISLRDIEYGGGNVKKLFSMIYRNRSNVIIDNKEDFSLETKMALRNYTYVIPYLFS